MATPIGALFADLGLNSAQFASDTGRAVAALNSGTARMNRSLATIDRGYARVSRRVGQVVRSVARLARGALAGGALGGAFSFAVALREANKFETSLSRIVGLVGVSRGEVRKLGAAALELGPKVGKGPVELGEALFFITSAGARGSKALRILAASAKASAGGLGETKTVADAVTSAVNAYGEGALTASQSTDIMVATVREGKLEAAELAGSLGRVLPAAVEAGVRFDEVGAAVAALTRVGLDASESLTGFQGILAALNRENEQGAKRLAEVGLSFADLRRSIRERGLLETLVDLRRALKGDTTALVDIFSEIKAVNTVLALTGPQLEIVRGIFERIASPIGATDDAFQAFAETSEFKVAASLADIRTGLVKLGGEILPDLAAAAALVTPQFANMIAALTEGLPGAVTQIERLGVSIGLLGQLSRTARLSLLNEDIAETRRQLDALMDPTGLAQQNARTEADLVALGTLFEDFTKKLRILTVVRDELQESMSADLGADLTSTIEDASLKAAQTIERLRGAGSGGSTELLKASEVASLKAVRTIERLRDAEEARAETIRTSLLTAQQRYNLSIAELDRLQTRNLISTNEYARAVGKAREELIRGASATGGVKTAIDEAEISTRRLQGSVTDLTTTAVAGLFDMARGADSVGEALLGLLSRLGEVGASAVIDPLIRDLAKDTIGRFDPFGLKEARVAEQAKIDVALNPDIFGGVERSAEDLANAFDNGTTPAAELVTAASGSAAASLTGDLAGGALESAAAIARTTAVETVAATAVQQLAAAAVEATVALKALASAGGGGGGGGLGALAGSGSSLFNSTSSGARVGGGFGAPGAVNPGPGSTVRLQHGAHLRVGGAGGVDSKQVLMSLTPGEELHAIPPGDQTFGAAGGGAGTTLIFDNRGADEAAVARMETLGRQIARLDQSIEDRVDRRIVMRGGQAGPVARAMGRI